jgi:hypothetical protein
MSISKGTITTSSWASKVSRTLCGFADVQLVSGLIFQKCGAVLPQDVWWSSSAAKPRIGRDGSVAEDNNGKTPYLAVANLSDKISRAPCRRKLFLRSGRLSKRCSQNERHLLFIFYCYIVRKRPPTQGRSRRIRTGCPAVCRRSWALPKAMGRSANLQRPHGGSTARLRVHRARRGDPRVARTAVGEHMNAAVIR